MSTSATFLGPVDHLPPEGADLEFSKESEVDFCASLFASSGITFDVSRDGVMLQSNPQETELFQHFEVNFDNDDDSPTVTWQDRAVDVSLQSLFPDKSSFSTLSDASEPEDYVRRFLEVLSSSLDDPALDHDGAKVPLIRWQAGEDNESAQVQLLGVLMADEQQFERFCKQEHEDVGLIFEDAEVQAHGLREAVTVLALLGVTFGAATTAEAGLFDGMKKKKQMRIAQIAYNQQMMQQAQAPIQQQRGWQDVHNDAYVNHDLLAAFKSADRRIVIDIGSQRAYLIVNNTVAIDTAISTARAGKQTPRGTFKITQRVESGKTSTIYGCSLPYWQRLDQSAVGLHVGDLPGYAASAGCIRLPHSVAPILFANTSSGVTVDVVDNWHPSQLRQNANQSNLMVAQVVGENRGS